MEEKETLLKIDGLSVSYPHGGGGEKVAVNNLNLEVKRSDVVGLLGPNGAGKTSLIKSILGLTGIKKGSISIFGAPNLSAETKRRIGYMPEIANYYWFLTSREMLGIFGQICGMGGSALKGRIDYFLEIAGLAAHKDQVIKNFSKGMQQRLNIAQALLHDPDLYILDEPFSGLDPFGRIHIRNIIKRLKEAHKTVLLSSHELSEAEMICDYICIIKDGRILKFGPLKELLEEKGDHSLEQYFIRIIGSEDE